MRYSKTKREKVGVCNLCLDSLSLSWDHVPPKGGVYITRTEMAGLLDLMGSSDEPPVEESQNGVKYRTICKPCNEFMGVEYDPHLNGLAREVGMFLKSALKLPEQVNVETKIQRVMKGVIGHMLAAKVSLENTKFDRLARSYVLDKDARLPCDIHLHYWMFPYNISATVRDVVIAVPLAEGELELNVVQIMKYFPIAYIAGELESYRRLASLSKYRNTGIDEVISFKIDLDRKEKPFWPEEPSDKENSVLVVGKSGAESVYGRSRIPLLKGK